MSSLTAPGTTRTTAPFSLDSFPAESTEQRTRRLALATERRHQRTTTLVSAVLVAVGGFGTLAFAAMMVSFH